jgi:hypothetical protein
MLAGELALAGVDAAIVERREKQADGEDISSPKATLGWNKEGAVSEEYLFRDNITLMQQIGVTQ